MKKILVAAAVTLMCGSAFAQTGTGPGVQSGDTSKPGVTNGTVDHKGKSSMNKGSGTTTGMGQTGKSSKHLKGGRAPTTEKDGMSKE
jgi:Ca2+-binding RTX toxin-like protein